MKRLKYICIVLTSLLTIAGCSDKQKQTFEIDGSVQVEKHFFVKSHFKAFGFTDKTLDERNQRIAASIDVRALLEKTKDLLYVKNGVVQVD
ncbi:hypothetical protein [Fictibacillus terranigra]|uniref:Uncharacterized protein n=1 Tax=Fictibacillus terranigra TaxID=3058424 RepID=A0ABT8E4S4_9BACL|nr:hypothetical protein [Fictibacillus sp. CENA-BCM004]MDN4072917.1 hypothetical protein [Fictibacillus sp. CENA-BCM004]